MGFMGLLLLPFFPLPGVGLIGAGIATVVLYVLRSDKPDDLIVGDLYSPIGSRLGNVIDAPNNAMSFERGGIIYHTDIEWFSLKGAKEGEFRIQFTIPGVPQQFTVQHKSFFANYYPECTEVEDIDGPEGYIYHSKEPEYLRIFLKSPGIMNELFTYPSGWTTRFRIMFNNGFFDLTWRVSGIYKGSDPTVIGNEVERICKTAILFQERIREVRDAGLDRGMIDIQEEKIYAK